jgi:hypothetical protein
VDRLSCLEGDKIFIASPDGGGYPPRSFLFIPDIVVG